VQPPDDPARALRLSATGGDAAGGIFWYAGTAWNFTYSTCIADTTLEIDVLPELVGPGASFLLQMDLSFHPERAGRPAGSYQLRYRVGGVTGPAHVAQGLLGVVDIPAEPGMWRRLTLDLVADVRALWPDLVAEDNSIHRLRVGLATRRGGTGRGSVRHVTFVRARRGDSLALMREVMARYAERYPDRRQYAALEVSLVRHLNWFGGELVMPDYGARAPVKDDAVPAAVAMVELIHRHGGLASYNHPLGGSKEATAEHMVATRALGADIVEIAYAGPSTVEQMLHVLDACARNLVFVTGNGVTDDHSGTDWYDDAKSNWVTKVWAPSVDLLDLQDALSAGRAWCYRPDAWKGTLQLAAAGVAAMGGVVVTGQRTVPVTVTATDLPKGGSVEVVTGRTDRAAPAPAIESALVGGEHSFDAPSGSYVRAMVRDAGGRIVGIGNPVWLLREDPPDGVPRARRLTL
jgi:hypothetical protein